MKMKIVVVRTFLVCLFVRREKKIEDFFFGGEVRHFFLWNAFVFFRCFKAKKYQRIVCFVFIHVDLKIFLQKNKNPFTHVCNKLLLEKKS